MCHCWSVRFSTKNVPVPIFLVRRASRWARRDGPYPGEPRGGPPGPHPAVPAGRSRGCSAKGPLTHRFRGCAFCRTVAMTVRDPLPLLRKAINPPPHPTGVTFRSPDRATPRGQHQHKSTCQEVCPSLPTRSPGPGLSRGFAVSSIKRSEHLGPTPSGWRHECVFGGPCG